MISYILDHKDKSYFFYHNGTLLTGGGYRRPDGTIQKLYKQKKDVLPAASEAAKKLSKFSFKDFVIRPMMPFIQPLNGVPKIGIDCRQCRRYEILKLVTKKIIFRQLLRKPKEEQC